MLVQVMRLLVLVLALLGPALAWSATTIAGPRPWLIERVALPSATDWEAYTVPVWARQVMIRNAHSSGVLYVGKHTETGAFVGATDEYFTIPAGGVLVLPVSPGVATTDALHLVIPLASATASLPVELIVFETPE
jgi:hypothetical protein